MSTHILYGILVPSPQFHHKILILEHHDNHKMEAASCVEVKEENAVKGQGITP